mmetsp:Transcript_115144/g.273730  ORF Transcript_115144/g.273730 Transcript_115144/m.273730 type:complete len:210 (-) Transcript_115144:894-1523(-)
MWLLQGNLLLKHDGWAAPALHRLLKQQLCHGGLCVLRAKVRLPLRGDGSCSQDRLTSLCRSPLRLRFGLGRAFRTLWRALRHLSRLLRLHWLALRLLWLRLRIGIPPSTSLSVVSAASAARFSSGGGLLILRCIVISIVLVCWRAARTSANEARLLLSWQNRWYWFGLRFRWDRSRWLCCSYTCRLGIDVDASGRHSAKHIVNDCRACC